MKSRQACPECKQQLRNNVAKCLCGWKLPQIRTEKKSNCCEYSMGEVRCQSIGTMALYVRTSSAWYCREHWHVLMNRKLQNQ